MQDIEVLARVRQGDTAAFGLLVEKYHRPVLSFIYRILRNSATVEDVGQDVFLRAYKSVNRFDVGRGVPFSAWVFTIARNQCVSELRKRKASGFVPLDRMGEPESHTLSPLEVVVREEDIQALRANLALVPEPFRESLLQSLAGRTVEQIARMQGVSEGTAKSRLFRARRKLKELLLAYYGGNPYGAL